eukprot:5505928-Heterocapsa_arctica.AAC.1
MDCEDKNPLGFNNEQKNAGEDHQHMADEEHENEGTKDAQSRQEQQQMDGGDLTDPQITGEQKEDVEPKATDGSE